MGKRKEQGNRKASLPQVELQGTIDDQTEILVNEYLSTKQDENTKKTYSDALKLLFRYTPFNQKPFDQFTVNDMNTFIDTLKQYNFSSSRIDMYISVMCDLKSYVQKWYSDLYKPDFMHGIDNLHLPINRNETPHFDLATLGKIRELIKDNVGLKYIFELVVQLGVDKKNIEKCLPQYANRYKKEFIFESGSISYDGTSLQLVIDEYLNTPNPLVISYSNCYYLIQKIQDEVKEKGIYSDYIDYNVLKNTHDAYMFTCPNCGTMLECLEDNWVLAKTENDSQFRLVCVKCKGKSENGGIIYDN